MADSCLESPLPLAAREKSDRHYLAFFLMISRDTFALINE
jgi:hypothetical protein